MARRKKGAFWERMRWWELFATGRFQSKKRGGKGGTGGKKQGSKVRECGGSVAVSPAAICPAEASGGEMSVLRPGF